MEEARLQLQYFTGLIYCYQSLNKMQNFVYFANLSSTLTWGKIQMAASFDCTRVGKVLTVTLKWISWHCKILNSSCYDQYMCDI